MLGFHILLTRTVKGEGSRIVHSIWPPFLMAQDWEVAMFASSCRVIS